MSSSDICPKLKDMKKYIHRLIVIAGLIAGVVHAPSAHAIGSWYAEAGLGYSIRTLTTYSAAGTSAISSNGLSIPVSAGFKFGPIALGPEFQYNMYSPGSGYTLGVKAGVDLMGFLIFAGYNFISNLSSNGQSMGGYGFKGGLGYKIAGIVTLKAAYMVNSFSGGVIPAGTVVVDSGVGFFAGVEL